MEQYTTWIKHYNDFSKSNSTVSNSDTSENIFIINVHESFSSIEIDLEKNTIEQIGNLETSHQMYFYSLVWICFSDLSLHKKGLNKIISDIILACKSTPYKDNCLFWDDHAVSERTCVLLSLLSIEDFIFDKDEVILHIDLLYNKTKDFLCSERFNVNNHRVFHLCSILSFNHYYKNHEALNNYLNQLKLTFNSLIDLETGFSNEQSISYHKFDLILLRLVDCFLTRLDLNFDGICYSTAYKKYESHLAALAFPDGTLPASGDTPLGHRIPQGNQVTVNNTLKLWKNLDSIGHYRGKSKDNKIHFHFLNHNRESPHGHKSPLHIDLWWFDFGEVLVDCGGPYKYGDNLRFSWFINETAHNCVCFHNKSQTNNQIIHTNRLGDSMCDGVRIDNNNYHYRFISSLNNLFLIEDKILSNSPWTLSFHFQEGIECISLNGINRYELKNKQNDRLFLSFNSFSDISLELKKTYRTKQNPKKLLANSLMIHGDAGSYIISTQFNK